MHPELIWQRITRYDPARRDAAGAYPIDDWTSIFDIGSAFGGDVLTAEEYETVESKYLEAVRRFADDAGVTSLWSEGSEHGQLPSGQPLRDHVELVLEDALLLVSSILRDEAWCLLVDRKREFVVKVHDLYLFVGSAAPCQAATARVAESGLFVERVDVAWPS